MDDDFLAKYWAHVEALIATHGWAVQMVLPTQDQSETVPFGYTIGLHDRHLPELLVFGLPAHVTQQLLNDYAQLLAERQAAQLPVEGLLRHENWPHPMYAVRADARKASQFATGAFARSANLAQVLQLVWPSKEDLFPWDDEASVEYMEQQPLLGRPGP